MNDAYLLATSMTKLRESGCVTAQVGGHVIALFKYGEQVYAIDNRCPHMGFPLDTGTVKDGILTCHWHHARFDLTSGGTFDLWADDVRAFPVEVREDEVWVDVTPPDNSHEHHLRRLDIGLERDIPLVIGKAVLALLAGGGQPIVPFRAGLAYGTRYRQQGWGQGLTILTCMNNLLPTLDVSDRPRALYQGLAAVTRNSNNPTARFTVDPLPNKSVDVATLKRWFRRFVLVRDATGAERCIVSAIRAGASPVEIADMLFSAVTDYRYLNVGHSADFTNKAFEALDVVGWEMAEQILTSLVRDYAMGQRMEETNSWRSPVDLVELLKAAFAELPDALNSGKEKSQSPDRKALVATLLNDDPQETITTLLSALKSGVTPIDLAQTVTYAAALRIARFHTSNEFPDWDTALHTFTFANAIEQGLRRCNSADLVRGIFDAAMSIYLDRFLNIPAAKMPQPNGHVPELAKELTALLNQQQQVNRAGNIVAQHLYHDGDADELLALLAKLLLREDRNFHTIQAVEAAIQQFNAQRESETGIHFLVAAARYLAAHTPTMRAQEQTYGIAYRLHRGDNLFEG